MNELWQRLSLGGNQILDVLPSILFAIAILMAGYLVARLIERWTDSLLKRLNFNKMAEAGGLSEAMERSGTRLDPIHAVGKVLFWLVMLVVILLASRALGLMSINAMFGTMLSYIPTLIAAIVIVILGMIVGEFVRALVLASAGRRGRRADAGQGGQGRGRGDRDLHGAHPARRGERAGHRGVHADPGRRRAGGGPGLRTGESELAGEITRRWYEEGRARRQAAGRPGEAAQSQGAGDGRRWRPRPNPRDHARRFERRQVLETSSEGTGP